MYLPLVQNVNGWWEPTILVRSQIPEASLAGIIRGELAKLDPQIAIMNEPKTIRQAVDDSIFEDRLLAMLGAFFGVLALALAAIGLYGVIAYGTARRSGEFGIRIALGAQRTSVLWMVLRDALILIAGGLCLGLPAAWAAANAVGSVLFEIKPADPVAFVITGAVLLATGLGAAFLPARRSASMDPMRALRHE